MTRPGTPPPRGRHSAPEEDAHASGRHAVPDVPAGAPRRHAAAEDDAYSPEPGRRRRHAAPDAERAPNGYQPQEPAPPAVNGYHLQEPAPPAVNGYHLDSPVAPVHGFPYTAPPPGTVAFPLNGHGVDGAERDAASWPVNGHAGPPAGPASGPSRGPASGLPGGPPRGPASRVNGEPVSWPGSAPWPLEAPEWSGAEPAAPNGPGVNGVNGYGVNGHGVNGQGPAPLEGWQREPFRPSYPTVLPDPPVAGPTAPPSVRPVADPPLPVLPPTAMPGRPPSGASTVGPSTVGPSTVGPSTVGPPTVGPAPVGRSTVGPPLPMPTRPGTVGPGTVGPGTVGPGVSGRPGVHPVEDDEATQVLRRYVPAGELLDREVDDKPPQHSAPEKPPHPPRAVVRRRRARRRALEWPVLVVFALVSAFLIRAYVVQTFYIPSGSMHETLLEGDRVLVNKISYRLHDVHRGDVIVFTRPPNLVVDDDDLIKRVVGLPGEKVEARGGKVYVNGAPLTESYVEPKCTAGTSDFGPTTVPQGDLWVMGDNRCNSSDSRVFGPISEKLVVGRAFVLVWPPGRLSWL